MPILWHKKSPLRHGYVAKGLLKFYECADSDNSAVINVPIKVVIITTPTVNNSIMNASHSNMKRFITASVASETTHFDRFVYYSEAIACKTTCVECFAATGKNSSKLIFDSLPAISDKARITTNGVAN